MTMQTPETSPVPEQPAGPDTLSKERPTYYTEIKLSPSKQDPQRLVFIAAPGVQKPPDDLLALRQDFERTARVASILFEEERDVRSDIFLGLHGAADRGLRGPNFNIEDGRANLVEMRETVTDSAHRIRDDRLRQYTVLALIFGVVPLLLGAVILQTNGLGYFNKPSGDKPYDPLFIWIIAAFWIPAGASICVWGEFALRMQGGLT